MNNMPHCHVCAEDAVKAFGENGILNLCANVVCQIALTEDIKQALKVQGEL